MGTVDVSNVPVLFLDWSVDKMLVQATTSSLTTYVDVEDLAIADAAQVADATWAYHSSPIGRTPFSVAQELCCPA